MRVLVVAGGTAGHVNPALAIAKGIEQKWPQAEIHFAGRREGMEYRLVAAAGYPFHHIEVHGFQRRLSPQSVVRNAKAVWHLGFAPAVARRILQEVQPDIVIGAGGYVSGPVLREAAKRHYKTAIHEQNAYPGVTNKLLARGADIIFAPSASAVKRLGYPEKTIVTGNPVRPELFTQNRDVCREKIGAQDRLVVLSYGGSLGAMRINQVVAEFAAWHLCNRDFLHIHATGSIEKEDFALLAQDKGIANHENFVIKEYIENMPEMLAAADLVIGRAGALTLAELSAVGRAAILIPSPNVAENHQYYNALEFQEVGAAKVIEEKYLNGKVLIDAVDALTIDRNVLATMGLAAKTLAHKDALESIIRAIAGLLQT